MAKPLQFNLINQLPLFLLSTPFAQPNILNRRPVSQELVFVFLHPPVALYRGNCRHFLTNIFAERLFQHCLVLFVDCRDPALRMIPTALFKSFDVFGGAAVASVREFIVSEAT